jgi:hypothetical protein
MEPVDKRIARLRDLTTRLRDEQMLDDIFSLIAELEAQKCALHASSSRYCGQEVTLAALDREPRAGAVSNL